MVNSIQFVNETDNILAEGVPTESRQFEDEGSSSDEQDWEGPPKPKPGKRTRGRVKIKMEYIKNKIRRYTTFSKRKTVL